MCKFCLLVQDSGRGLSEDQATQVAKTLSEAAPDSNGLGYFANLAKVIGGELTLHSSERTNGSTFKLLLTLKTVRKQRRHNVQKNLGSQSSEEEEKEKKFSSSSGSHQTVESFNKYA